jgi:hypothetical protein
VTGSITIKTPGKCGITLWWDAMENKLSRGQRGGATGDAELSQGGGDERHRFSTIPRQTITIREAGVHRLTDWLTARVTSEQAEGTLMNELVLEGTDTNGKPLSNHFSLPYGANTWSLLCLPVAESENQWRLALATVEGAAVYRYDDNVRTARFSKPGLDYTDPWAVSAEDLKAGKLPQFPIDAVVKWANDTVPKLAPEPNSMRLPEFELRLIAKDKEQIELVRPFQHGWGGWRDRTGFVRMGPVLLEGKDIESTGFGSWGVLHGLFAPQPDRVEAFLKLCDKYHGREAALIKGGKVVDLIPIKRGEGSFSTPWVVDVPKSGAPHSLLNPPAPSVDGLYLAASAKNPNTLRFPMPGQTDPKAEPLAVDPNPLLTPSDLKSAEAVKEADDRWSVKLTLNADAAAKLAKTLKETKAPGAVFAGSPPLPHVLAIVINGKCLLAPQVRDDLGSELLITGRFTEKEARDIAAAILMAMKKASDARKSGQVPLELRQPGEWALTSDLKVKIESTPDNGTVRNELQIFSQGKIADTIALPYGNGTWAVYVTTAPLWPGYIPIVVASEKTLTQALIERKTGQVQSVGGVAEPSAERALQQGLQPEVPWPATPEFEVRLVAKDDETPEMVRVWKHCQNPSHDRFVRLGKRLLTADDVDQENTGTVIAGGVWFTQMVKAAALPEFEKTCQQLKGRIAAVVQKGVIWRKFELKPGLKSFDCAPRLNLMPKLDLEKPIDLEKAKPQNPETKPTQPPSPSKISIDPKLKGDFSFTKNSRYPWHIIEHPDGHLENTLGGEISAEDRVKLPQTASVQTNSQGDHEIIYCEATLDGETLRLFLNESDAAYHGAMEIVVAPDQTFRANWTFNAVAGKPPEFQTVSQSLTLDRFPAKAGEVIRGKLDVAVLARSADAKESTLTFRGLVSTTVAAEKPNATPKGVEADAATAAKNGISLSVLDSTGKKPIPNFRVIAGVKSSVSAEFEKTHGAVVVWQPHTLREGKNGGLVWPLEKAYEEMALRVEADGYEPQVFSWIDKKKGAQDVLFQMKESAGIPVLVNAPDGSLAVGATLSLGMVQRDAVLENGKLRGAGERLPESASDAWRWPRLATTDKEGRCKLPAETDVTAAALVVHESGVREISLRDLVAAKDGAVAAGEFAYQIKLQPWAEVSGSVQWGSAKGTNVPVHLSIHRDDYGYPGVIAQYEQTTTDAEGNFTFARVLPGLCQLSIPIKSADGKTEMYVSGQLRHATLKSGGNKVIIGGQGRTVKGKLTGRDKWDGVTFHFHPTAPHIGMPGDDAMWKAWSEVQNSPRGKLFFRDGLGVRADGTFEIKNVLPGDYQIFFSAPGGKQHLASSKFDVPPEEPGNPPDGLDIGEIKAH